jgi:hypothetical protein
MTEAEQLADCKALLLESAAVLISVRALIQASLDIQQTGSVSGHGPLQDALKLIDGE